MIFSDDFNGSSVDSTKWNLSTAQDGNPNNWHTPANNQVANGILTQVTTRRDANNYNVGYLTTANKFETVYGYIEARVKTSWAPSVWPSFWMVARWGWPPELDIFENWGSSNAPMSSQNWHYRNAQGGEQGDAKGVWLDTSHPDYWNGGWGANYHTYAAHWQEGKIDFYIDGTLTHTSTKEVTTLPMYIILSNGLGGAEHGTADFSQGPADFYNMKVDYVKVWNRPMGTEVSRSGWSASAFNSGAWWPPSNAIDANGEGTRWTSGMSQSNSQWFQLDLGSARTFDTVVVKCWASTGDAAAGLAVYTSDSPAPSSWGQPLATKVENANIQDLNTAILKFSSQTKRYIRLVQTGAKSQWWSIEDIRLYSANGGGGTGGGGNGGPVANGTYRIINRNSGKALDVAGVSTADGAQIQQWTYGGGNNQKWVFERLSDGNYRISALHSGKYMDIAGASTADGAANIQWPWNGGNNQKWRLEDAGGGYFRIVNVNSGKVLDIEGASHANGARDIQWYFNGGWNQNWQILAP